MAVLDVNAQVATMEQWLALLSPGEALVALQHVLCRLQPVQAQYLLTVGTSLARCPPKHDGSGTAAF